MDPVSFLLLLVVLLGVFFTLLYLLFKQKEEHFEYSLPLEDGEDDEKKRSFFDPSFFARIQEHLFFLRKKHKRKVSSYKRHEEFATFPETKAAFVAGKDTSQKTGKGIGKGRHMHRLGKLVDKHQRKKVKASAGGKKKEKKFFLNRVLAKRIDFWKENTPLHSIERIDALERVRSVAKGAMKKKEIKKKK